MRPVIPLDRLPPVKVFALRQLAEGPLTYRENVGWLPGYPSPSGDARLAFNSHTINWIGLMGWARVDGTTATITTDGLRILRELDGRRAA